MPVENKTFDIVPRKGRGLITAYDPANMGELLDSFEHFRQVYIRDNAWVTRDGETVALTFPQAGEFRAVEVLNKITDHQGTVDSSGGLAQFDGILVTLGGSVIAPVNSPYELCFEAVKNRLFVAGSNNSPQVWDGSVMASWGAAGPAGTLSYIGFNAASASAKVAAGTCTVNGTVTVTSAAQFTTGSAWVGKTMIINGIVMTGGIASVTNASTLVLNTAVNPAVLPNGSYPFLVCYGERSWSIPPKYAYAYYNPTTGHCTNGSPVLTLTESNQSNVNVALSGIATNATLFGYGYTKIILFRTLTDGAILQGLFLDATDPVTDGNGFLPNVGGPLAYVDHDGTDYNVGTLVGPAPMPEFNDPAPEMRFVTYWQGRFWGIEADKQWRIRFSGSSAEIQLGVAEECWPAENFRDVSSKDGAATSVKVAGSSLVIGTYRYAYYIAGTGPGDFQLVRLSTRAVGVNQYAIDEQPGDSSVETASVVFVSRDRRLWRQLEGGKLVDIGAPIQNRLDGVLSLANRRPYLLKVVRVQKMWLLVLGILMDQISGNGYDFYFYDFDQETWMDWGYMVDPETSQGIRFNSVSYTPFYSNTADAETFIAKSGGASGFYYQLFRNQVVGPGGTMRTQALDMGDPTAVKSLQSLWLFVNDTTLQWKVNVYFERSKTALPMVIAKTVNTPSNITQGKAMCFVPQKPEDWHLLNVEIVNPSGGKLYRIRGNVSLTSYGPKP